MEYTVVSVKKLLKGEGVWAVRKEVLGWIIDGATVLDY